VAELLKDRILVGHAVKYDLAVLGLLHPREKIRDTSLYEPFRATYSAGNSPSLKKTVQGELGVNIQVAEHDSVGGC
jgi:RNA exonuclease 4